MDTRKSDALKNENAVVRALEQRGLMVHNDKLVEEKGGVLEVRAIRKGRDVKMRCLERCAEQNQSQGGRSAY